MALRSSAPPTLPPLAWPDMAVSGPETRPDSPGLRQDSDFWARPAKLTLPGPVRPIFGQKGQPCSRVQV